MHQSIPPAPSPAPPPGNCGAFARLVSPGGGAFANVALPGSRAFANPRANPELLTARGFLSEDNYKKGFTGGKADWLICQLAQLQRVVTACSLFYMYVCIFSLLIKPALKRNWSYRCESTLFGY